MSPSHVAEITGWHHTPFGKLPDETVESLVTTAAQGALAAAGLGAEEVDEIVLGHFNGGLSPLSFTSSLVLEADPALRFTPATRVENACATGSAAVLNGVRAIASGEARTVLVVGVEKMTHADAALIGRSLLSADYGRAGADSPVGFTELFAEIAEAYFARYGDRSEALAAIAAKNHLHGVDNPYAQLRKDLGVEFCNTVSERNPLVAGPLRRTDCSPSPTAPRPWSSPLRDRCPRRQPGGGAGAVAAQRLPARCRVATSPTFAAGGEAWRSALDRAGLGVWDLDLLEVHDCFTIAELIEYEVLGLCEPGRGTRRDRGGWTRRGGRLPVNRSGGLKSKGHPIGATGVSSTSSRRCR